MRSIHTLMVKFSKIEGATVGRGYKHPTHPAPELEADTKAFFAEHPFLQSYPDYIAYLECYAGAFVYKGNDEMPILDFFGLSNVSTHLISEDGPLINDKGYMTFFDSLIIQDQELMGQAFAFDSTGTKRFGIYRYLIGDDAIIGKGTIIKPCQWYCEDFLDWLEVLIITKGQMPDDFKAFKG